MKLKIITWHIKRYNAIKKSERQNTKAAAAITINRMYLSLQITFKSVICLIHSFRQIMPMSTQLKKACLTH